MKQSLKTGDPVIWRWANGYAHGTIVSIDTGRTEITRHGKNIARDGTADDPAVTIMDHNNTKVLKLASELQGKGD